MVKMFGSHLILKPREWGPKFRLPLFKVGSNSRRDGSLWQSVFNWSWGHAGGGFQTRYSLLFFLYYRTWYFLLYLALKVYSLEQIRKMAPSQQWWSEAPPITWWMTLRGLWMMGSTPSSFWSGYVNTSKDYNKYTLRILYFASRRSVSNVVRACSPGQAAGTWSRCHRDRTGQAAHFLRRGRRHSLHAHSCFPWLQHFLTETNVTLFLCYSPALVWSSMLLRSLLKPLRCCHVRLLRTLVWRLLSSSLNCTPHITRETKTWALISRYVQTRQHRQEANR